MRIFGDGNGDDNAAQLDGVINGQLLDVAGKPWADMTIEAVSDQGSKTTTKSDKDGNFTIHGLRSGVYSLRSCSKP